MWEGYPRNVSDDFRSTPGTGNENIPGNMDSVFFDRRDGNMYFFKNDKVNYIRLHSQRLVCLRSTVFVLVYLRRPLQGSYESFRSQNVPHIVGAFKGNVDHPVDYVSRVSSRIISTVPRTLSRRTTCPL